MLSFLPCADRDCKQIDNSNKQFITTNHEQHEDGQEDCSPFCICDCCGQITNFSLDFVQLDFYLPSLKQTFPVYSVSFQSETFFNIWQPPKLA
jgi:hypothetical protein